MASINVGELDDDGMDLDEAIPVGGGPVKVEAEAVEVKVLLQPENPSVAASVADGEGATASAGTLRGDVVRNEIADAEEGELAEEDVEMSEYEKKAAAEGKAPDLNTEAPPSATRTISIY